MGGLRAACAGVGSVTLLSLGDGSAGIGSVAQWPWVFCTGWLFTATTASTAGTAGASGAGTEVTGGCVAGAAGAGRAGAGDATGGVAAPVTVTTGIDFSSRLPEKKKSYKL